MSKKLPVFGLFLAVTLILAGSIWLFTSEDPAPTSPVVEAPPEHPPEAEHALIDHVSETYTGDLDGMEERGFVRILTTYSIFGYFHDGAEELGFIKEAANALVKHLNKGRAKSKPKLDVVIIPVPYDQLIPKLLAGEGDIAAANLTITFDRLEHVAFTQPWKNQVREIVVTGPAAPHVESFDDLAVGGGLHVRRSSSYYQHIERFNVRRALPVPIHPVDETFEDGDLLELVDAGVLPAIVIDDYRAKFWQQFFPHITLHENMPVNVAGEIAWAIRKQSPLLQTKLDEFMNTIREGTLLGNILLNRYYRDRQWIVSPTSTEAKERLDTAAPHLKRYADQYDFDWLLLAAQAFQESRLDHDTRSHAGAIGIMQVMPATARDARVELPDIEDMETNIHAGVKYLRVLYDQYFSGTEFTDLDRVLFSFAAYNAGPRNIARARKRATKMGLDPDVWFGNVEIAAARSISREPVNYVRNIYKYYLAYRNAELVIAAREAKPTVQ